MILIGGENLIDLIEQPPAADATQPQRRVIHAVEGGSPYNTAIAAGRLGAEVGYLTPISTDVYGQRLRTRLEASGVQVLGPEVRAPTSLALVSLVEGQASYQFYRQGTADRQVDLEELSALLSSGHALHIGSLALTGDEDGEVWTSLFERASEMGLFTSVDLNIRPQFAGDVERYRARLKRVMSAANLVKLSDEDLEWWVGRAMDSSEEQRRACLALGRTYRPQLVFLTRGSRGATAYFELRERVQVIERRGVPPREFTDTVGAGDTFMGGVLSTLSELVLSDTFFDGWNVLRVEHALLRGTTAASITCERSGCEPPTLKEVLARQTELRS